MTNNDCQTTISDYDPLRAATMGEGLATMAKTTIDYATLFNDYQLQL